MTELATIPTRLARRPRFRGMPVPYVFYVREDGTPDFTVIDHQRLTNCVVEDLCGLCGCKLGRHTYFIGGPACAEHHHYSDPPMHEDCARYALQVCPFLAMGKSYSERPLEADQTHDHRVSQAVPEKFGLLHGLGYTTSNGLYQALRVQGVEWHYPAPKHDHEEATISTITTH